MKEVGSGASRRELRETLLAAARRREIDVVVVWRLDRWGRSVADLVATLQELQHLGVGFVSLTEALDGGSQNTRSPKATPARNQQIGDRPQA
jgi:DNA invertase Pin-like site-specific DNA recombinase